MKKILRIKSRNKIKKTLKKIFWSIMFLTTIYASNSLQFTEIMYNPQGSDTGREWVELSNPECENLEEYKLLENNVNHNIILYSEGTCNHTIICDDCDLFLDEYNVSSLIYESSFTLSNTGEFIAITYNNTIVDYINYTNMENIEGMSLTLQNKWVHMVPTPGSHIIFNISINQTNNQTNNQTDNQTINTTINQTVNQTINDTINLTMNITTNETINSITNNNTDNMTITNSTGKENKCNVTIGIKIKEEKRVYYDKETIKFYNTLNVTPAQKKEFYIEYWIEDIYGNILKNKVQTNNLNEKTYTPNINERTVAAVFKNRIINVTCEYGEANILNENSEDIIVIKNPEYKEKECEKCEKCEKCYSDKYTEKESQLKTNIDEDILKIEAYRGNDRKYSINTAIKNGKDKNAITPIKISLEKYSGMTIDIPILIGDCGEYRIITEGLGFIEEKKYVIECKDTDYEESQNEKTEKIVVIEPIEKGQIRQQEAGNSTKNISQFLHNSITGNVVYESRNEETKKYSLIGIIFLISGSAIYAVYKLLIAKKTTPKDL